jgi:hypothetical protein
MPRSEAIFEFWVPQSNTRADVAVVGATMDGFEIKTERDSLKRLPRQADAYTRVFDFCHVVLAQRHVEGALGMLPQWWGVLTIGEDLSFTVVRGPKVNSGVDPETLVRLLWRDEAYAALCDLGAAPDPRAGRFGMWELLLALLDIDRLKQVVRHALLLRSLSRDRVRSQPFAVT